MSEIRIYVDDVGFVRVDAPARPLLPLLLESDVREDLDSCRETLDDIDRVLAGDESEIVEHGNASTLTIGPEMSTIEHLWNEEAGVTELRRRNCGRRCKRGAIS